PMFAAEIRKKRVAHMRGHPQWRWHLDEVFVKVNGQLCYLWRGVDHEGEVLEAVVTAKRDKAAALKLLKRIMKKYGRPRSVVTDGLWSYVAAMKMKEIGNADRQEVGRAGGSTAPHFWPSLAGRRLQPRAPWRRALLWRANSSRGSSFAARAACASRWPTETRAGW